MTQWYNRPLVFVRDCHIALDFYVGKLGFQEDWRHEEKSRLLIVQVSREGTELILTEQWAARAGQEVMFISINPPGLTDDTPADVRYERETAAIDALKAEEDLVLRTQDAVKGIRGTVGEVEDKLKALAEERTMIKEAQDQIQSLQLMVGDLKAAIKNVAEEEGRILEAVGKASELEFLIGDAEAAIANLKRLKGKG